MVVVRKPGRPLSTCPHQQGKGCNCNNITAAIPRKGKCGCGTPGLETTSTGAIPKTEPAATDIPPMSPTRTAPFRVQKATAAKVPSRKQSYDLSHLNRMDPNTFNMMISHSLSFSTDGNINRASTITSPGFIPNLPAGFESGSSFSTRLEYPATIPRLDTSLSALLATNGTAPDLSPTTSSRNETPGRSSLGTISTPHHTPTSSSGSFSNEPMEAMSCCAKESAPSPLAHEQLQPQTQAEDALGLMSYDGSVPASDPGMSVQFNQPVEVNTHIYAPTTQHVYQPTIYTYPASYGSSVYEPLQYSQWQQMMADQLQTMPTQNAFTNSQSSIQTNENASGSYTTHHCGCGPGCQCVGCAAHPFNLATQEYVRSAVQGKHSRTPSESNGHSHGAPDVNNGGGSSVLQSPMADTPSSGSSDTMKPGASELQQIPAATAADYFYVTYDLPMGCDGDSKLCPCGDDCACVGCMFHGNTTPQTPTFQGPSQSFLSTAELDGKEEES
ncbi:hypothetical protein F5Y19DRAFT_27798 [Xylariaceae sp. FL1651]|nr:hypothetical protein F5Y19DRAFT_27798 [Xylariaceae sp. FL1651]